jgi:transcriptional regulator with XRE-family HTH domain
VFSIILSITTLQTHYNLRLSKSQEKICVIAKKVLKYNQEKRIMNYFYDNIRYIRKKRKLNLESFAELIGVNASTVSRWERKEIGVTVDTAVTISQILKIPIADLVGKDLRLEDENYQPIPNKDFADEIADILRNSTLSQKKQEKILSDIEFYREDD